MSLARTVLLGAIAGTTILLGLPLGRLRAPRPGLRVTLNAVAVGVLLFLLWDVLSAAWDPIDGALGSLHEQHGGWGRLVGYSTLFVSGLAVGLFSLVAYETWQHSRRSRSVARPQAGVNPVRTSARELALLIAVGIGLHNFAEGLAIGQSAASGAIGLATLLVIGFGLHNATEGFGIVAPLAAEDTRPGWKTLLGLGAIGGGPTFLGAALGRSFTSAPVSIVFLTLAAGSILYVVVALVGLAARVARRELFAGGLMIGLLAGFATDAVVTAAGA